MSATGMSGLQTLSHTTLLDAKMVAVIEKNGTTEIIITTKRGDKYTLTLGDKILDETDEVTGLAAASDSVDETPKRPSAHEDIFHNV